MRAAHITSPNCIKDLLSGDLFFIRRQCRTLSLLVPGSFPSCSNRILLFTVGQPHVREVDRALYR
jgi:hypothetical protein